MQARTGRRSRRPSPGHESTSRVAVASAWWPPPCSCCRWPGSLWQGPVVRRGRRARRRAGAHLAAAVARLLAVGHGGVDRARGAARLGAGPRPVPRSPPAACRWSPCRWCCRRSSAASRCSGLRPRGACSAATSTPGSASRCRSPRPAWSGRDVRRHAVPGHHRRGCAARRRPPLRGGRRDARRRPVDDLPPRHAARWSAPALAAGAVLCWARALGEFGATITFAGNFPGRTQTHAARRLPGAGDRPGGRDRAQPRAARRVGRPSWPSLRDRWLAARVTVPLRSDARLVRRLGAPSTSTCGCGSRPARWSRCSARTARARPPLLRALAGLRPLDARPRQSRRRRPRRPADPGLGAARAPPDRRGLPGLPAVPAPQRPGQRGLRACVGPGVDRRAARATAPGVARPGGPGRPARTAGPGSSPAGRRSGWRWPGRWPRRRRCCCSTSRSPRSTPAPADELARELRRHLSALPGRALLVTHDPLDAMALADRLVIVEGGPGGAGGRRGRASPPARARDYVADLVGLNLYTGQGRTEHAVRVDAGG